MKLTVLVGPSERAATRWRTVIREKEAALQAQGIIAPEWNHVRLYTACARVDEIGVLRHRRGLDSIYAQETLRLEWEDLLEREVPQLEGDHVVMAAAQLGQLLCHEDEVARLAGLLCPHFTDIQIVIQVDEQARALAHHYMQAIIEGRRHPLSRDLALAKEPSWWDAALAKREVTEPYFSLFNDVQAPPFWLDYSRLLRHWATYFSNVTLCPLDLMMDGNLDGFCGLLGTPNTLGKAKPSRFAQAEPEASLTRMRHMNECMIRYGQASDIFIPYDVRTNVLKAVRIDGPAIDPGSLSAVSDHFAVENAVLIERFPALANALDPDPLSDPWQEADPKNGFRATQYLTAFAFSINKHAVPLSQKRAERVEAAHSAETFDKLALADEDGADQLRARVKFNHQVVLSSPFRPHNVLGSVDEETDQPAYTEAPTLPRSVIVGCMKNEAPYILEWIAYHRAIGVEHFVIYTNGCEDGTDTILKRLEEMGILQHRDNNNWKGNSPQQHALNNALKEPVVNNANWLIHTDVDEFINVRTGNGTLADLIAAVPDSTNIAMTWRLFGHDNTADLHDTLVIDQFETCAPKFCPKPHNTWGFKTMFRNTGAYAKMSAHRPNKLNKDQAASVKWVNGSGQDVTRDLLNNGWRSSKSSIGYDLVQLNHYALRSAASFLIKRQRGRALHVDRSIGINYWVRMDWSDARDITIKRNIPRVQAEMERLLTDPTLRKAHEDGCAWHHAKVKALKQIPEFSELYEKALNLKLNATERAAYALALDMQS